jgi:hypothetical protein
MLYDLDIIRQKYLTPCSPSPYQKGLLGVRYDMQNINYLYGLYQGKHFSMFTSYIRLASLIYKNPLLGFDVTFCTITPDHEKFIEYICKYMTYDDCIYQLNRDNSLPSRVKILFARRIIQIEESKLRSMQRIAKNI